MFDVDIPLPVKEARARGLDASISRIISADIESSLPFSKDIADCLFSHSRTNMVGSIYVTSYGEFMSLKKLSCQFENYEYYVNESLNSVRVTNLVSLNKILSTWDAEILIVVYGKPEYCEKILKAVNQDKPAWWKYSNEGYESVFLRYLDLCDSFCFYSPSRGSLEIMGNIEKITFLSECLQRNAN